MDNYRFLKGDRAVLIIGILLALIAFIKARYKSLGSIEYLRLKERVLAPKKREE